MTTHRIALGRVQEGYVGYALSDGKVQAQATGRDAPEVLAILDRPDAQVFCIGGDEATPTPCSVLPESGQILPALCQSQPADIVSAWVRLWVAGYLASRPDWDGVICVLHGDVTHWLHLSAGEVVSCQSSLTQRLLAALGLAITKPDEGAISDSLTRPERLATQLRAAEVSGQDSAGLGHLIGVELAATRAYWLGQQVAVIGGGEMAQIYAQALAGQGVPVDVTTPEQVTPAGLVALAVALG